MRQPTGFSLDAMPLCRVILVLSLFAILIGCTPQPETQADDQNEPFFVLGRKLVIERDFKRAVDSFEKTLELNPRHVGAHYEVALLYETKLNEPAIALYHYKQVLRLRPSGHPAEIVMARMKGCEQEIAKNVALVQVDPAVMAELERLKEENRRLQRDLETMRALASSAIPTVYTNPPPPSPLRATNRLEDPRTTTAPTSRDRNPGSQSPSSTSHRETNRLGQISTNPGRSSSPTSTQPGPARPTGTRVHYVKERETFSSIARRYGVGVAALRAANPSLNPERLKPGQALQIPAR
jgi:LysM repeat protein